MSRARFLVSAFSTLLLLPACLDTGVEDEIDLTVQAAGVNQAPSVTLTSPTNGATFAPGTVSLTANASDPDGVVTAVELFANGTKIGEDLQSPYSFAWVNVAAGTYDLTARATDNGGAQRTSSPVRITVRSDLNQAPSVTLTSPTNGATFAPGTISLTANASDPDGVVTAVELFANGTKIGEDLQSPYSFAWVNVAAGTYDLTARATDNGGAQRTSSPVRITVQPDECQMAPTYVENGGYVSGSEVKNAGRIYTCKPWPYSGWCNAAAWAYAPGTGLYWQDAWVGGATCP